jgi:hypothetical protein
VSVCVRVVGGGAISLFNGAMGNLRLCWSVCRVRSQRSCTSIART